MHLMRFLRASVKHPTATGAIAPSSSRLSDVMTDAARLSDRTAIVEFGPGTGVFTAKILEKKPAEAVFFAIELNADLAAATRKRCPAVPVYNDCAANTPRYLKEHGLTACDCIICGLPWAAFSEELQDKLLATIMEILRPDGRFLTFAYLQGLLLPAGWRFRRKIQSHFTDVTTTKTVWRNVPPAFVYCARK